MQNELVVLSKQVLLGDELQPAAIHIKDGKIVAICSIDHKFEHVQVITVSDESVVLPGLVDSHVHVNEPGRTQWEGFESATKTAASGGVTCLADMPLNSIPPTTTVNNFFAKLEAAKSKCWIDTRFIGGVVPDNETELLPMLREGACGFKCFLIGSGIDEFPHVNSEQVKRALETLKDTNSFLMFHAELEVADAQPEVTQLNPKEYNTFLQSRPKIMENTAIELVIQLCKETGVHCHIVHLSSADAIPIIEKAKKEGVNITVETCFHYLFFESETIPDAQPEFKCCPPIRESSNREKLWKALKDGVIDMVVSDHSPCTEELKQKGNGDYLEAWGGIPSLQWGLAVMYTEGMNRGHSFGDLAKWMSFNTSSLIGISHRKGKIEVGYDGDLVVFNPTKQFQVDKSSLVHKNKLSPYEGYQLSGVVEKTIVRGQVVYDNGKFIEIPQGSFILESPLTK